MGRRSAPAIKIPVAEAVAPVVEIEEKKETKKPARRNRMPRTEIRISQEVRKRVEAMCDKLGVSQNFLYVYSITKEVLELERLIENGEFNKENEPLLNRGKLFEMMAKEVEAMFNSHADKTGFTVSLGIQKYE